MTESDRDLAAKVDQHNFKMVTEKLLSTRKVISESEITYDEVEHSMGDKVLKLRGTHVPLEEVYKFAKNRCKTCSYGKGYYVTNIPKANYPDPRGHMLLEPEIPEDLSEEQREIMEAKIASIPTWKIINVCKCASERALAKNPSWVANANRNLFIDLDFNFVDKPTEEKVEKTQEL